MGKKKNILDEICSLRLSISELGSLYRALACTMDDSELLDYYSSQKFKDDIIKSVLEKRDLKRLAAYQHKTIGKKITEFSQKKRGYSCLRMELKHRYEFASKADKRKIVEAFLTESRQDRIQAYQLLKLHRDSYITDKLVSIYNQYHDNECLIVFIKHYPRTFINDKFDAIAGYFNYPYACYCMGADYVRKIDKHKMSPIEWLRLMATFKQNVSVTEAEAILYYHVVNDLSEITLSNIDGHLNGYFLLKIRSVRKVVSCMGYLGMAEAIHRFGKICEQVNAIVKQFGLIASDDCETHQSLFNKIGNILPEIPVEDGFHDIIKEWVLKGQPVCKYSLSKGEWRIEHSNLSEAEQNQDDCEFQPVDDVPF